MRINKSELMGACAFVDSTIGASQTKAEWPANSFKFMMNEGSLVLEATDGQVFASVNINIEDGDLPSIFVNARDFVRALKFAPAADLEITPTNSKLKIAAPGYDWAIPLIAVDGDMMPWSSPDLDGLAQGSQEPTAQFPYERLCAWCHSLSGIPMPEAGRYAFSGFRLYVGDNPGIEAADGRLLVSCRGMACMETEKEPYTLILPQRILDAIPKWGAIKTDEEESIWVYTNGNAAVFDLGHGMIGTRLIEGSWPDTLSMRTTIESESVTGKPAGWTLINKQEIEKTLGAIMSIGPDASVKLHLGQEEIIFQSQTAMEVAFHRRIEIMPDENRNCGNILLSPSLLSKAIRSCEMPGIRLLNAQQLGIKDMQELSYDNRHGILMGLSED